MIAKKQKTIEFDKIRHAGQLELSPQIFQLTMAAVMRIYIMSSDTDALGARRLDDTPLTLADLEAHRLTGDGLAIIIDGLMSSNR